MSELTIYNNHNLPSAIQDLNKFILVGREKLTVVKAEIRAIKKLEIAEEVYRQKEEETRMLAEALLDAETRVGELLQQIPKASGGDRSQIVHNRCSSENVDIMRKNSNDNKNDSSVIFANEHNAFTNKNDNDEEINISDNVNPKQQVIKDLGFTLKQANRFETLANNKDLVEQVKAEAREKGELPTRTRVLELAFERKKEAEKQQLPTIFTETDNHIDSVAAVGKKIITALGIINSLSMTDEMFNLWYESVEYVNGDYEWELKKIRNAKANLVEMERFLIKQRGYTVVRHGK